MAGPLQGVRVLDFGRIPAGPRAGYTPADLGIGMTGAERPGLGDGTRGREVPWFADLGWHAGRAAEPAEPGFGGMRLRQVGRGQQAVMEAFGERMQSAARRR
jgi:hypothetical protein